MLELFHLVDEPLPLVADPVCYRYFNVVEEEFGGVAVPDAELFQLSPHLDPGQVRRDHKEGKGVVPLLVAGAGQKGVKVCLCPRW